MKIKDGIIVALSAGFLAIVIFLTGATCNANFWFLMFNLFTGLFIMACVYEEDEWIDYEEDEG